MNVREEEDRIRLQAYETAIAWQADGQEILRKDGHQFKITFTDQELELLPGALLTHNHPSGLEFPMNDPRSYGNSFSRQDLRLACYAQLAELRVVTPRRRFTMKPPPSGWNLDYWEKVLAPVYDKHRTAVSRELKSAMQAGTISLQEAEARHFHEICFRVASELQLPYEWEEN